MGRYYWDKKKTVENCLTIEIPYLTKHGYFCGHKDGRVAWSRNGEKIASIGVTVSVTDDEGYIKFNHTTTHRSTGDKSENDYNAALTITPCQFGGVRYWFICPRVINGNHCGRRVGTLYLPPGGGRFGCRHCYNLSYKSRNKSRYGPFGNLSYLIKTEQRYEDLYYQVKRWTYDDKPTRKARKLQALEAKMEASQNMLSQYGGI